MIKSAASFSCSNMFYFAVIDNLDRKLFKASHFNFPARVFLKLVSVYLLVCGRLRHRHSLEPRYQRSLDG